MELLEGRGNAGAGQWASARARGGAGPRDSEGARRERSRGIQRGEEEGKEEGDADEWAPFVRERERVRAAVG